MSHIANRKAAPAAAHRVLIYRHGLVTRITHWINVLCLTVLLLSGLQILNAYPSFHWGQIGADADPYIARIEPVSNENGERGVLRIGSHELDTTGMLGVSRQDGEQVVRAFPSWMTLPSGLDLATGRRWHFFFAWIFVLNGLVYLGTSLACGHVRRDLLLSKTELRPRHLWHEIVDHARLRFPTGEAARRYNALQKLTYLTVIFLLLPMMLLTGLTMSPAIDAAAPFLLDLFGGRPSARTIHFITASLLVAFVIVHVAMVLLSGVRNNVRSMITGRYVIELEGAEQ
jgi:thiosulfate reductase cytochrome b subunit